MLLVVLAANCEGLLVDTELRPIPAARFRNATLENPECDDEIDNDGDGLTDFADPKCLRAWPYWERSPACGLGVELALVILLLALVANRRRCAS